jgi:hypothetical protein
MIESLFWGGVVYVLGFGLFVQRQRVLDTPTAKATSAAIGRAELCGTAHGDPPQPSLVTDTPCAYWEVELHRRVPNGKGQKVMKRIGLTSARIGHLWVEDASGRMPVLVDGAHWWLDAPAKFRNRRGDAIGERARAWVRSCCGKEWEDGEMKLVERRLEEGGPVYVLGTLSPVPDLLRAPPEERERRRPRSLPAAIVFGFVELFFKASPTDALGSAIERIRDGRDAAAVAEARAQLPDWLRRAEGVAIWRGTRRDPFLIANCAENRLAVLLARWGFAALGLGTLIVLSGVWKAFD